MTKTLLIPGCSYGLVYSEIEDQLKQIFDVDRIVNLSQVGSSPDRQIRVVIEWIAQNGRPDMVIMPVSHYNRFDLPIAKEFDPLHNLHFIGSWQMREYLDIDYMDKINPLVDIETLQSYLKTGVLVNQIEHTIHDYLFVKLITFQSYLQSNEIRHLIFDTGNYYEKLWMKYLSIDEKDNSGYQPGMKKRDLIENCPGIYKFFSFCSNVWMYENHVNDKTNFSEWNSTKKLPYPLDDDGKATIHHHKEQVIKLMEYLKHEGAIYG